ncbi:MAG TPA: glycerol-3-phosphate 1-O-acyltransferase PlsY [Clostridiales bacterium]|nr:glycerol-3-phosphate 1-O-acyltransferase PlsY [Clostridiales bacterium]
MSAGLILFLKIALLFILAYFLGGVHFATIISKIKGVDIKTLGSGNPGTMNMLRNFGVKIAALTLILDALKGALPALLGYFLLHDNELLGGVMRNAPFWLGYYFPNGSKTGFYIGGISVIIGHMYPILKRFKGGKGVASSVGIFLVANPIITIIAFVIAFIYLYIGKYGSVASFIFLSITGISEIVLAIVFKDNLAVIILVASILALIIWAHRSNILRLFKGTESDINIRRQLQKKREGKLL